MLKEGIQVFAAYQWIDNMQHDLTQIHLRSMQIQL